MAENITLATPGQIQEIYQLSSKFRDEDAGEINRQIAEIKEEFGKNWPVYSSGEIQTPLLPVEDLRKFYIIHKSPKAMTVTREIPRMDISPYYHELTWIDLSPRKDGSVVAHNSTRLQQNVKQEEEDTFLELDEFIEYAEFLGHSQLDVVSYKLCDDLIRQLGATVIWR